MQTEEQDEQLTLLEDKAARFKFSVSIQPLFWRFEQ